MDDPIPGTFTITARDPATAARTSVLQTAHGPIETPVFMPVGTQGTVKTLHPKELVSAGASIILGNTYHLFLRPGCDVIREMGGLHAFSSWDKPILTDSGGYQVFSLAKLRKISEEGVRFQSHIDGTALMLSPEIAMEIQATLGSDIAMLFDECPPWPCDQAYADKSLDLTLRWARRCRDWVDANQPQAGGGRGRQLHFGIVQGSVHAPLREKSAKALVEIGFDGYAIGGMSVGEPEEEMFRAVDNSVPFLPLDRPRYAMGLGTPPQLLGMIARGVDMFDCVMPTRLARHGTALTADGPLNLKNRKFERDPRPLAPDTHPDVLPFSRAYIRHLLKSSEILALRLLSLHNVHFYLSLMAEARRAIASGEFSLFHSEFTKRYHPTPP